MGLIQFSSHIRLGEGWGWTVVVVVVEVAMIPRLVEHVVERVPHLEPQRVLRGGGEGVRG
jgi:hypothetical protein